MLIPSRWKPRFWDYRDAAAGPGGPQYSFRRKWVMIVAFTTMVALTPLVVMTLVDYRLTRQAFESEATMSISRMVSNTWRSVAFLLAQRRAALQFVARDNRREALLAPGRLDALLDHLQRGMSGFIDLAVVDADCTVRAYAGPYRPQTVPPGADTCFKQALSKGYAVSDVRRHPQRPDYLVAAVRQAIDGGGYFILQATLDAGLLDEPLAQLNLDDGDDAFIVNRHGALQTPARHYGSRFEKTPLVPADTISDLRVANMTDPSGNPVLVGMAPVPESPFTLFMVRQKSGIMDQWLRPRMRLIGFLAFSIVLILVCILGVATYLVNRIHAADRRRVQALHQVEYANKLASIGRLASGVAHEVNNPLAIINQKAGLIKDLFTLNRDLAGHEKLVRLVDDVLASVQRCGAITRRLLDFARHMESAVETVDIEAVIRQVLAFTEKDAERRCITVSVDIRGRVPAFESDRGNLQQIFLNLINNAFAAMDDGGRLTVTIARQKTAHIRVSVADTGRGIPPADLEHIFEPFFSTGPGHGGTGLGLSVTYGMVSEMGGEITVDSEPGKGSCFTVVLPLMPPRPPSAAAGGTGAPIAASITPTSAEEERSA